MGLSMADRKASEKLQMDLARETDQYLNAGGEVPGEALWAEVQTLKRERLRAFDVSWESRFWPAGRRDASNRIWAVSTREQEYRLVRKRIWSLQKIRKKGRTRMRRKQCVRLNGINIVGQENEYALGTMLLPDYVVPYQTILRGSGILFAIIALCAFIIGFGAYGVEGAQTGLLFAVTVGVIAAGAVFVFGSVISAVSRGMKSTRYEIKKSLFEKEAKDWNPDFIYEQFLLEALLKFERWIYTNPDYEQVCDVLTAEVIPKAWEAESTTARLHLRVELTEVMPEKNTIRSRSEEYCLIYASAPPLWPEKREILDRWQLISCERETHGKDK